MQKRLVSIIFAAFAIASSGCRPRSPESATKFAGNQAGGLRGYAAISSVIAARLIAPTRTANFDLLTEADLGVPSLRILLGDFSGDAGKSAFRNAHPNAVNMLLWRLVMGRFSQSVGDTCAGFGLKLAVSPDFATILAPFCGKDSGSAVGRVDDGAVNVSRLPDPAPVRVKAPVPGSPVLATYPDAPFSLPPDTALRALWDQVMLADAPEAEWVAWRDFMRSDASPAREPDAFKRVPAIMNSLLLNPYFLLEH